MSTAKKGDKKDGHARRKKVPPADYRDEITDEQFAQIRELVSDLNEPGQRRLSVSSIPGFPIKA